MLTSRNYPVKGECFLYKFFVLSVCVRVQLNVRKLSRFRVSPQLETPGEGGQIVPWFRVSPPSLFLTHSLTFTHIWCGRAQSFLIRSLCFIYFASYSKFWTMSLSTSMEATTGNRHSFWKT